MNIIRCANGHFFDADNYKFCPHCDSDVMGLLAPPEETLDGDIIGDNFIQGLIADENFITVDPVIYKKEKNNSAEAHLTPVVGWLVAIAGSNFGEDFKLKSGRNFIGRSTEMDVALTGDSSISRDKHAIILYEPKGKVFFVQPSDAKELFYLNDKVVLTATEINAYDVLSLGGTKLLFIPCCSDKFNWE